MRYAGGSADCAQGETITNILGGFNRKLFVNLVGLLLVVFAFNTLALQLLLLFTNQLSLTDSATALNTAIALALGVGMLLVAFGLWRKARWGWLGTLVVSGALIVLIVLQLGGMGLSAQSLLQLAVFAAIFLIFLLDTGVKALLWGQE